MRSSWPRPSSTSPSFRQQDCPRSAPPSTRPPAPGPWPPTRKSPTACFISRVSGSRSAWCSSGTAPPTSRHRPTTTCSSPRATSTHVRRQGAGRLSEVVGKAAVDSDRFELQLGLLRTAQAEWAQLQTDDQSRQALVAYAQGVNDRIAEAESMHQLDAMFTLLGYQPQPWSPIDSLLVKGDMTQTL
ncbi:MAG: penicillin acylase family protein, partial [Chloroflexi bacterium]